MGKAHDLFAKHALVDIAVEGGDGSFLAEEDFLHAIKEGLACLGIGGCFALGEEAVVLGVGPPGAVIARSNGMIQSVTPSIEPNLPDSSAETFTTCFLRTLSANNVLLKPLQRALCTSRSEQPNDDLVAILHATENHHGADFAAISKRARNEWQ